MGKTNSSAYLEEMKQENIKNLIEVIEALQEAGEDISITVLSKYLQKSRQYFYKSYIKEILEQYKIGSKFKNNKLVSKEYLLERIKDYEEEHRKLKATIDKLNIKLSDNLNQIENLGKENTKLDERLKLFQLKYYRLLKKYDALSGKNNLEVFDINVDSKDNIKAIIKELMNEEISNIINFPEK